jgi:hypothetical protein
MRSPETRRWLLAALFLFLVPMSAANATGRDEAEDAIGTARALHEQAKAAGVASQTAADMLRQAEALLAARAYFHAMNMANWARRQDSFALEVARGEITLDQTQARVARAAIDAAVAAADKANSVAGEWRDTRTLIEQAEALAKAGDFGKALAKAEAARRQGELGYEQAVRQKGADMPEFMRQAARQ